MAPWYKINALQIILYYISIASKEFLVYLRGLRTFLLYLEHPYQLEQNKGPIHQYQLKTLAMGQRQIFNLATYKLLGT